MAKQKKKISVWEQNQLDAIIDIQRHAVLGVICDSARIVIDHGHNNLHAKSWMQIGSWGVIWLNPKKHASKEEWIRFLALSLLNLGFGHIIQKKPQALWELAAFLITDRFCLEMGFGKLHEDFLYAPMPIPSGGVESLFTQLVSDPKKEDEQLLDWYKQLNQGNPVFIDQGEQPGYYTRIDWKKLLATGIVHGVDQAIAVVANRIDERGTVIALTRAQKAKQWIIDNFPLLGAMAAGFELEEDIRVCQQYDISVAAIDVGLKKVYLNPAVRLSDQESRFVMAHELLHAGLNHASRRRGRDKQLWNAACDFVINSWLMNMQIGAAPSVGMLYDVEYDNKSAEEIYDLLATNLRRARKLITMRGNAEPDMIGEEDGNIFTSGEDYCRRALMLGLDRCLYGGGRGLIPAGLIEEIRSLNQPPITWDVKLAEWFDAQFPALELSRTYARPSRRQSATPDIPRTSIKNPTDESRSSRVFGVVLDTSGSMEPQLLGKALGAIASYSMARDVYAVRLICCDAAAYDSGWIQPEQLLYRFTITGRGGTVLQPGIDCLNHAAKKGDFPAQGPVLIITDGECEDHLSIGMTHAFLLPQGAHLPFIPRGDVFHVS